MAGGHPWPSSSPLLMARSKINAEFAHGFRQICPAKVEMHWHSEGSVVHGEPGMLMGLHSAWERQWKGKKRPGGGRERNPVQLQGDKQNRGRINMKAALEERETKEVKSIVLHCVLGRGCMEGAPHPWFIQQASFQQSKQIPFFFFF